MTSIKKQSFIDNRAESPLNGILPRASTQRPPTCFYLIIWSSFQFSPNRGNARRRLWSSFEFSQLSNYHRWSKNKQIWSSFGFVPARGLLIIIPWTLSTGAVLPLVKASMWHSVSKTICTIFVHYHETGASFMRYYMEWKSCWRKKKHGAVP